MKRPVFLLMSFRLFVFAALLCNACADKSTPASAALNPLVEAARKQVGVTVFYNPAYVKLDYPGGDVPEETGVCTDVVVRAYRGLKFDLQKEVHEDMRANFSKYPKRWGLKRPDKNIDHRRVPNLMTFFERKKAKLPISKKAADYKPGDVVAWDLTDRGLLHIGIVSDRKTSGGTPLILHNIGGGAQEEDRLFDFTIIGHYRFLPEEKKEKRTAKKTAPAPAGNGWVGRATCSSPAASRGSSRPTGCCSRRCGSRSSSGWRPGREWSS